MEFSCENLSTLHASQSYSSEELPVSLRKRGRPRAFDALFMEDLRLKYDALLEIDNSKLEHVMSCLPWMPQAYHGYYESLKPKQQ